MAGVKGMKQSIEHSKKISMALTGLKKSKEHRRKLSIAGAKRLKNPEDNPNYKGDNVGYIGIHIWLRKYFGNPEKCLFCNLTGTRKTGKWNIVWALKQGFQYERKRENFIGLCNKCHRNYDKTEKWNNKISIAKKTEKNSGIYNPNCKHTIKEINEIKKLYKEGVSMRKLASMYGYAGHAAISDIIQGKKWKLMELLE